MLQSIINKKCWKVPISAIFGIYLKKEAKYKKSGRTMTFAAAKLVQVQIFVSIGKVIAKKNGVNRYEQIKLQIPYDLSPLYPTMLKISG